MLKAIRVSAMLLVLVGSAHAGIILTPPVSQAPSSNTSQELTTTGESDAGAVGILTHVVLDLLAALPSLP